MSLNPDFDETYLVNQLRSGDEKAFSCIYETYWKALFNHAYKRLYDQEMVRELIQDLFTELWEKRENIHIHTSLKAYLYTALKFKVLNHIKAQIVREKYVARIKLSASQSTNQVEEQTNFNELNSALQSVLDKLPPQPRKVFALKRNAGLSYQEIAERLQISSSTVEKHMIKALKIIRENLRDYATPIMILLSWLWLQ